MYFAFKYVESFLKSIKPLLLRQAESEGWRRFSHGKSFILDKDTLDVVKVILFTPCAAMESVHELLQVAQHFDEDSKTSFRVRIQSCASKI